MRVREGVVLPDFRRRAVVQHHVHPRQRRGGVVHLLPVQRQVQPRPALGFVVGFEQQRAGTAGGVVNALRGVAGFAQVDDHGHDARDFRRGVELPLALARLSGEVTHQILVGVTQQVVALGSIAAEIQPLEDGDQLGQPLHHRIGFAELLLVVEVGKINCPFESSRGTVVGVGQLADDFVDPVADFLAALGRNHVGKAAARRHVDQGIAITGVLVGDVLDEQQDEDVILVLAGIHAPAQLVAGLPQGGIEFGFLEGHGLVCLRLDASNRQTVTLPHGRCPSRRQAVTSSPDGFLRGT